MGGRRSAAHEVTGTRAPRDEAQRAEGSGNGSKDGEGEREEEGGRCEGGDSGQGEDGGWLHKRCGQHDRVD